MKTIIQNTKCKEVKNWISIKEALILFLKNYEGNNVEKVDLFVNAKNTESRSESLLFNSNFKKNEIADISLLGQDQKYKGLKIPFDVDLTQIGLSSKIYSNQASFLSSAEIENLKINPHHSILPLLGSNTKETRQNDLLTISMSQTFDINAQEIRMKGKNMNMRILLEKMEIKSSNAKKELIHHLKQHICLPSPSQDIIWEMTSIFKEKFNKQYKHFLNPINRKEVVKRHEFILEELRNIIRTMKKIIKRFLRYLFKNKFDKLVDYLENKDLDINITLNAITYQIIFDADEKSTHYKLIYELLKIKHEKKMKNYLAVAHKLINTKIESYDDSLNDIFWLQNFDKPYDPIVLSLRNINNVALNPFHKFELISVIDEEIAKYLETSYRQQNQIDKVEHLLMELKEPNIKYAIINYCLIHSLNENLILDLYFMKEFINVKFQESSSQFIIYEDCLIDCITSGWILEKVEDNMLKNSLKISSKTDKTFESTSPTIISRNSEDDKDLD